MSEKCLRAIVFHLPDAVYAIDTKGVVVAWNREMEELTGIDRKSMVGKGDYEYAIPFRGKREKLLIDLVKEPDEDMERNYDNFERKNEIVTAESHTKIMGKYFSIRASSMKDSNGKVLGYIESIRDITDKKQIGLQLERERQKFTKVFQCSPDAITIASVKNGTVLDVNDKFLELTGYKKEECIGKSIIDLVYYRPEDRTPIMELVKEKESIHQVEIMFKSKNGTIIWGSTSASSIDICGEKYVISITRDITTRKEAERILVEQRDGHNQLIEFNLIKEIKAWNKKREVDEEEIKQILAESIDLVRSLNGVVNHV